MSESFTHFLQHTHLVGQKVSLSFGNIFTLSIFIYEARTKSSIQNNKRQSAVEQEEKVSATHSLSSLDACKQNNRRRSATGHFIGNKRTRYMLLKKRLKGLPQHTHSSWYLHVRKTIYENVHQKIA